MISCDTNILFHAACSSSPLRDRAHAFLLSQAPNPDFAVCELVLVEFYVLLRNPAVLEKPLSAAEAVDAVQAYRRNRSWRVLDYPGNLMSGIWRRAAEPGFARRRIFDACLAMTLRHFGVDEFATRNLADFQGFGFRRVWDPLSEDE